MRHINRFMNLVLVGVITAFAGCGGSDSTSTPSTEDAEEAVTTTDAAFLEEVRESEEMANAEPVDPGLIDPDETGTPPKIDLGTDEFDMGVVSTSEHTIKQMPVYNRGGQPLVISKVSTSCGCTTGRMIEDTIAPGETGMLEIEIDPDRINGYRSRKTLTLASNDPATPAIRLIVAAQIPGELLYSVREFGFGTIDDGVATDATIHVTQTSSDPVELGEIEVRGGPEFITVSRVDVPQEEWKDASLPEWTLVAHVSEASKAGRYAPTVKVPIEDGRGKQLSFPVRLIVRGNYAFEPYDLTLRNIEVGQVRTGVTKLTSRVPLTVEEVSNSNPNMKVTLVEGDEPNSYGFDIVIPEPVENRLQKDEWTVSMTVDGESVTETVKVVALMKRQ